MELISLIRVKEGETFPVAIGIEEVQIQPPSYSTAPRAIPATTIYWKEEHIQCVLVSQECNYTDSHWPEVN